MSDTPRTLTIRKLNPGEETFDSDLLGPKRSIGRGEPLAYYREVNPIPDGYEVCDLTDAAKVLIGETWCDVKLSRLGDRWLTMPNHTVLDSKRLTGLGVLAIRPIPDPEPLKGEAKVLPFSETKPSCYGWARIPNELIGKRVRWEVIE